MVFGGSTLFGYGSNDQNTIPSLYNQITGKKVLNFGDTGWHSRQSLNQLLNVIGDGYIPSKLFFTREQMI